MKDCIICGGPTGSREHIFPAALGGRRTNKGIYCGDHNEDFSPLAAVLSNQLSAINAFLAIRPDHSDEPRSFETVNPADRQKYLISALNVELAEPKVLKDEIIEGKRQIQVLFSNEQSIQEWIAAQRAVGNDVQMVGPRQRGRGFFTQPFKAELELGGIDGLRAIGYVAMTFLAHYFPETARSPELKPFKDFLLGANDQQPVWWDFGALPADVPDNAFRFGHRILIGLSASRQEAFARVFLFSTLSFSVHFGPVRVESDENVIVDIDPLADHPPNDIREIREKKLWAEVEKPSLLTESLRQTVESGGAQARLSRLLNEISTWQIERTVEDLLPRIKATMGIAKHQRFPKVNELLAGQGQRVLNLMLNFVAGLKRQFDANPATAGLAPALEMLVMEDVNSGTGISQPAACALELATGALADEICRDLEQGHLDEARLLLLLCGGPGVAVVGQAILHLLRWHWESESECRFWSSGTTMEGSPATLSLVFSLLVQWTETLRAYIGDQNRHSSAIS